MHLEGLRNIDDGSRRQQSCCREAALLLLQEIHLMTSGARARPDVAVELSMMGLGCRGMAV
jgi:hypothetical protein